MSTVQNTIAWLRRLAVVSCPEITCKQAAEVAEMLAEYADENMQLTDEFNAMVDERDTAIKERDALKTEVEAQASTIARLQNLLDPELLPHPGSGRLLSASPINAQRRRGDK